MTDKEQDELLTKFGNEHTLSGDISVSISSMGKTYSSKNGNGSNYDDVILLDSLIRGAESFCYWLRRNDYSIIAPKPLPKNWGKVKIGGKLKKFENDFLSARKITSGAK